MRTRPRKFPVIAIWFLAGITCSAALEPSPPPSLEIKTVPTFNQRGDKVSLRLKDGETAVEFACSQQGFTFAFETTFKTPMNHDAGGDLLIGLGLLPAPGTVRFEKDKLFVQAATAERSTIQAIFLGLREEMDRLGGFTVKWAERKNFSRSVSTPGYRNRIEIITPHDRWIIKRLALMERRCGPRRG